MKLMILDGNSIINRAFYGLRPLTAPDGTPTQAVYGFLSILMRLLEDQKPEAVAVTFDKAAPTFRHDMFEDYKAQRKPMPEELAIQLGIMKEVLDAMGIERLELAGFEADDILGTVGRICEEAEWECCIVTGDKDSFQLISEKQKILYISTRGGRTETVLYDKDKFYEVYGFEPALMIDLKSLMGDPSDNIPGVAGIGEKTASALVREHGSVKKIYETLDTIEIKDSVRKKLREGQESAKLSYTLAEIDLNVPISFTPSDAIWDRDFSDTLYGIFKRLGFKRFVESWGLSEKKESEQQAPEKKELPEIENIEADAAFEMINSAARISIICRNSLNELSVCDGKKVINIDRLSFGERYDELLKVIFSENVKKVSHNVKDVMTELMLESLPVEGFIFDTALAAYLLDSTESSYELKKLGARYINGEGTDAQLCFELYPAMSERLKQLGMDRLMYEMELPLCRVLADMENCGCLVDRSALHEFADTLNVWIDELREKIWESASHEFNINSPKQLGEVLFDELGLPSGKKTKTGRSTNADVLEKLIGKHPIVSDVLEYRMLTKLKSTYADGLLKVIAPDGRIHTSFKMTVAATGRLSSTEPNLQNIPIRRELGSRIRKMFVAPAGSILVDADYSQIELRILADISGDETMKSAFINGEDIHSVTASRVFDVPLDAVTAEQRSRAKAVNFGIVYGISAFSLAQDIGVWPNEAKAYIDAYLEKYNGVRDYMEHVIEKAKEDGFVATMFGRRRPLPELRASNFNTRSFGERVARNMPIQGAAADIIKLAMVNVYDRLKREGLKARLILQVHDELLVECPESEREAVSAVLGEEMQNAAKLSVPLEVSVNSGSTWGVAH